MRSALLFSVVSTLAAIGAQAQCNSTGTFTGCQGDAPIVTNNPVGPTYIAVLPDKGSVKGSISATAGPGGVGVQFTVSLSNFPKSDGPFPYHLHVLPVNSTGSCASTLAHLDTYIRGEKPPCDASAPATCQVGDLSGKHGKVPLGTDPFITSYVDPYVSLTPGVGTFFGNRSFVVHYSNTTRINCASFSLVTSTGSNVTATATTSKPAQFTGSAASITASLLSVFGVVAAALFL